MAIGASPTPTPSQDGCLGRQIGFGLRLPQQRERDLRTEVGGYTGKLIDPNVHPFPAFEGYGTYLDPAVFPTPIYETTAAALGFAMLWAMRTKWAKPGQIFAAYLMFNGFERFWIEKIRVNTTFDLVGITMTQAELISFCTFLAGFPVGLDDQAQLTLSSRIGREREADAVDAVTRSGGCGAVGKHVTQVAVAP